MKRILALVIALSLVAVLFAACAADGPAPAGTTAGTPGTSEKPSETTPKPEETTVEKTETTPKQEETEPQETELPTKRTIYSTDTRDALTLFQHGVNAKVVNNLNLGKGYVCDGVMDPDGKLEADGAEWDTVFIASDTSGARFTNDGEHKYFPFAGYTRPITFNEIIIGDVTHWTWEKDVDDEYINPKLYTDYSDLEVWYTDNPNGTWIKWDVTVSGFENNDFGELWGTYAQGIRFTGEDVTASYFLIYDPDPQVNELLFVCNYAAPAAIYNPHE